MEKRLSKADSALAEVARRETKSVLRERGFPRLATFSLEEILSEIQTLCPKVFKILSLMFQLNLNAEKNTPPLALVYGMVMFRRFHKLSHI